MRGCRVLFCSFRKLAHLFLTTSLMCLLVSCGGASDESGSLSESSAINGTSAPSQPTTISGFVVMAPVTGATVNLYAVSGDGSKQLIDTVSTGSDGGYAFKSALTNDSIFLIEANGGSYIDESTGQFTALTSPLRAFGVWDGSPLKISLTPFSEVAVRAVERETQPDWSASHINAANENISSQLGITNILDFNPINLRIQQDLSTQRSDDVMQSIFAGGFSVFSLHLNPISGSSVLNNALESLYRLMIVDENDDILVPKFILGLVDFIGLSTLPLDTKDALKRDLLMPGYSELSTALPSGIASGGATSTMQNDAFEFIPNFSMVSQSPIGTVFNSRGALVGYQINTGFPNYRALYTGSAAEVYGDGDVGIGRWNGGVIVDAIRSGKTFDKQTNGQVLQSSWHYVVGRPATSLPTCGSRTLGLVSSTLPTLTTSGTTMITGLTPDSVIGLQYLGDIDFVGVDIGLQLSDGSVIRFTTTGGIAAPWASGSILGAKRELGVSLRPTTSNATAPGAQLSVYGIVAGAGARKAAVRLHFYSETSSPTELAAVFNAPDVPADANGCAITSSSPGYAINPPPVDDSYQVFAGIDTLYNSNSVGMGAPLPVIFGPRGEIASVSTNLNIPSTTQTYELAGNADAIIGRAVGPFVLRGNSYKQSLPYAIAKSPAVVPSSGSRHYILKSATSVVANIPGSPSIELLPGQITNATLDINFGENPIGTSSSWYGSARLSVTGIVDGLPFTVNNPIDSNGHIIDGILYRGNGAINGIGSFEGSLAGANSNYAVIRYKTSSGMAMITGTLLFISQ